MVFGFVKQSGGHIKIYSEEGHGTTVKIYLPRSSGLHQTETETMAASDVRGGHEVVLIVEDDALVRKYVITQIESLGYTTLEAANATEALDIIDNNANIDLLFTDVIMPGPMNGRQLVDRGAEAAPRRSRPCSPRAIPKTPSSITAGSTPACCCLPSRIASPNLRG